jgi:hypothetical protein
LHAGGMRTNLGKEGPGADIPARAWVGVEGEEWARREEPGIGGGPSSVAVGGIDLGVGSRCLLLVRIWRRNEEKAERSIYEIRFRDWGARAAGFISGPVFGEIGPIILGRSVYCLNQLVSAPTRVVCLGLAAQTIKGRA